MLGTVFMVTLPELLRGYVNLQQIMFGAILFATMAFLPGGLIELGRRLRALLWGHRRNAQTSAQT
jgi:branched-chain amino acid transport system permease protein